MTVLMGEEMEGLDFSWFDLSKYEVTNEQFAAFVNHYGSDKVKAGEFAGETMIVEYKWGLKRIIKADLKFLNKEGVNDWIAIKAKFIEEPGNSLKIIGIAREISHQNRSTLG